MIYKIFLFFTTTIVAAFIVGSFTDSKKGNEGEELVVPFGLPPIPWPADNPYNAKKAALGRLLYFDKRLSSDGTVSCATCHNLPCGYSDCRTVAVGISNNKGIRHSPTVINSAYL